MSFTTRSPIVVGLDGSPSSDAALAWAVDAARRLRAPMRLVHAIDLTRYAGRWQDLTPAVDTQRDRARSLFAPALAGLKYGELAIETYLELGRPASILLEQSAHAQMVVVGSRGHGDLVGLLLGSTSLQVAMHAACPVVVVREPQIGPDPGRSAGRVLVGVDGTEVSEAAIQFAFEEADTRCLGLTALHAWQLPDAEFEVPLPVEWAAAQERERALLAERLAGWGEKYPDVDVIHKTRRADPASALVTESTGAALTVVGSRGAGGFKGLLLGSVSHAVLHHAGSPVAIVRTGGAT